MKANEARKKLAAAADMVQSVLVHVQEGVVVPENDSKEVSVKQMLKGLKKIRLAATGMADTARDKELKNKGP